MQPENLFIPSNRQELRDWLTMYAETGRECWVVIKQLPEKKNLSYLDIVEEAICFGWIDSTKKKISEFELAQKISPRSKKSSWTELNKARARRLIRTREMTDQGLKSLPDLDISKFVIDSEILEQIEQNPVAKVNFQQFPALYQRVRIDTIQSYKLQPQIFEKRLLKFIENTEMNKMYGLWNDNGRLEE